jgi:hypothetical protein
MSSRQVRPRRRPRRARRASPGSSQSFRPLAPGPLIRTSAFADRFHCRLAYNEQFTAAPSAGSSDGYVISIQSLYDPRFASGGHQPQFFDQISALWTYFVVKKVRIRLTCSPDNDPITSGTSSNNVYQPAAIIAPFNSTTGTRPSAAASDMLEWPGAVSKPMMTSGMPATVMLEIDIPKFFKIPWRIFRGNPAFWGTNGGNPSTMVIFAFVGACTQGSGAPLPVLCQATIEYDAEFFVPTTLATS